MQGIIALFAGIISLIAGALCFISGGFFILIFGLLTTVSWGFAGWFGNRAWKNREVTGLIGIILGTVGFFEMLVSLLLGFIGS